jgi:hypothetical protein
MSQTLDQPMEISFIDRRGTNFGSPHRERRQFVDSHEELSPAARELAEAIDGYKLRHRRRFISHEELISIVHALGYHK